MRSGFSRLLLICLFVITSLTLLLNCSEEESPQEAAPEVLAPGEFPPTPGTIWVLFRVTNQRKYVGYPDHNLIVEVADRLMDKGLTKLGTITQASVWSFASYRVENREVAAAAVDSIMQNEFPKATYRVQNTRKMRN